MRTLFIDIETSPNSGLVFDLWNQNISLNQLMESGEMLCFSAVWYHEPRKPLFFSNWEHGHEDMVREAWRLLDETDVACHYNGRRFDVPWLQRSFLEYKLNPPSPFRQVDLYQVVKSQFQFPSNKLEYVSKRLLGQTKMKHEGFPLWTAVMAGDEAAQKRMKRYCIKDTRLLVPLYERLLPWIPRIPSHSVQGASEVDLCPACGGTDLRCEGYAYTQTRAYQRYQCRTCGKWSRATRCVPGSAAGITETPIN